MNRYCIMSRTLDDIDVYFCLGHRGAFPLYHKWYNDSFCKRRIVEDLSATHISFFTRVIDEEMELVPF